MHARWLVRYTSIMAIEVVLQQALEMPPEERVELVERLIDSLEKSEVELSAEELAHIDDAIADADRAIERGGLILLIPCSRTPQRALVFAGVSAPVQHRVSRSAQIAHLNKIRFLCRRHSQARSCGRICAKLRADSRPQRYDTLEG
jgi:Putative addiction module component